MTRQQFGVDTSYGNLSPSPRSQRRPFVHALSSSTTSQVYNGKDKYKYKDKEQKENDTNYGNHSPSPFSNRGILYIPHHHFFYICYEDKRQDQIEALSIEQYYNNATTQYLSLSFMGSSRRCRGRFFLTGDRICMGWLMGAHLHQSPGQQSQRW